MTDPVANPDAASAGVLEELSIEECWSMLGEQAIGRLAVSINNEPDIFPVNYLVDDGTIVFKTAPGLKLAASTLGRAVAFEVDALDGADRTGISVVIRGHAAEVENLEELLEVEDLGVQPWVKGEVDKNRFVRIEPVQITGRRIRRSPLGHAEGPASRLVGARVVHEMRPLRSKDGNKVLLRYR